MNGLRISHALTEVGRPPISPFLRVVGACPRGLDVWLVSICADLGGLPKGAAVERLM
jgi:hypothetical protein